MVKLKDVLPLMWTITQLNLDVRTPEGLLIRQVIIGDGCDETNCGRYSSEKVEKGELEIINTKVNFHGQRDRHGYSEMGWGVDLKKIPKWLLELEVTSMRQTQTWGDGGSRFTAHLAKPETIGMEQITFTDK